MAEQGARPREVERPRIGLASLPRLVRGHAATLLEEVLSQPFSGELFLAGGAFKPLLNPEQDVRDLDLWVRDRRSRERLLSHLVACGAEVVRDFHPYCIKLLHGEREIELTYQNVKGRPIGEVVEGFDIACCAIAATYRDGKITDSYISPRALRSAEERQVMLTKGYIDRLLEERPPDILQSIDRLSCFAEEVGFDLPEEVSERLWKVYEEDYDEDEQRACMDTYLSTTVEYKGRVDLSVLRRATRKAGVGLKL